MEFYYESHYAIDLCREYIKHDNVYDKFSYTWEENEDHFLITFLEFKNSIRSLQNSPKPTFKVVFEDLGTKTGIHVEFIKAFLQPTPFVYTKEIDEFWKRKLDAEKISSEQK